MACGEGAKESHQAWDLIRRGVHHFGDPLAVTIEDPDHSQEERRSLTTSLSPRQRLIIVAHTDREGRIRIFSARDVTPAERKQYESGE
jgi:uncharacterized DUF497 family protein